MDNGMKLARSIKGFFYYNILRLKSRAYPEEPGYACVNGQRLFYVMRGPSDGKPVVLLHGNGGSHKSLRTQAMELALAGYRIYSPDSRGQGANAPLDEYHYSDMAEDCFLFIKELGLGKPAVYGWSDGGIIALMLEMSHPGTCGPIAISGANLHPDCGEDFEAFKEWILSEGTPLALMMLKEPDIKPEELSVIKGPVLVTAGSRDLISTEHTELIADSLPNSELEIFEGETHGSFIKRSPKIGRRMLEFFRKNNY